MRKRVIFTATSLLLVMASCNQEIQNPAELFSVVNENTRAEKNPLDEIDFSALDTVNFVSGKDIEAYIHFKQLLAEGQGKDFEVLEVVPMGLNDEATLAYLLNYNEGWEIISADKRAPMLLASGEEGSFSEYDVPENVMAWIECLESDVLGLRVCKERPEWADEEAWENMLSSVDFWLAINADEEYISGAIEGTRNPKPVTGYWELVSSTLVDSIVNMPSRLIPDTCHYSDFDQRSPYNQYCPLISSNSSEHALTGCVAVAGSMMLCYLHDKIGLPSVSVIDAYYTGTLPTLFYSPSFDYHISNTFDAWTVMGTDTCYAASLQTFVGHQVDMEYGATSSGASPSDLVENVFNFFDISCTYGSFSTSGVNGSLQIGMPVIVSAYGHREYVLGLPVYSHGHVFIVDSYCSVRYTYRNVYRWVYVTGGPFPIIDDRIEIETQQPIITAYQMRWGAKEKFWWDDNWFSPTGNWILDTLEGDFNYIYDRHMITGFSAAN